MIKASDLRIGNWIYIDNGEKPKYFYQISAHDIEEIEGNGIDCFPIPLTPQILEKAGFVWVAEYEEFRFKEPTNWFGVFFENGVCMFDRNNMDTIVIDYVHQLQNLIHALKMDELEITL